MKVAVASDLHLEFADITILNEDNVDVLVLSGDILVDVDLDIYDRRQVEMGFARFRSERFQDFFARVCTQFPHVVYVAGNHEHYHGDFKYTLGNLKRKLARFENLHILDKEVFVLDDTTFIGGTLWTDMNKQDPLTMYHIKSMMNDFRVVQNSNTEVSFRTEQQIDKPVGMTDDEFLALPHEKRYKTVFKTRPGKFSPDDAVTDHMKMMGYIESVVAENADKKYVVVGHHSPSFRSQHDKYKGDDLMNGGYHSALDEYIMERPQIKLWTHGHTHEVFDYMIGETRVVCNPRGYAGYEETADNFKLKVVEL